MPTNSLTTAMVCEFLTQNGIYNRPGDSCHVDHIFLAKHSIYPHIWVDQNRVRLFVMYDPGINSRINMPLNKASASEYNICDPDAFEALLSKIKSVVNR